MWERWKVGGGVNEGSGEREKLYSKKLNSLVVRTLKTVSFSPRLLPSLPSQNYPTLYNH